MLDEPPKSDRLHVEVVSMSSRMGLLHPKVRIGTTIKITSSLRHCNKFNLYVVDLSF